MKVTLPMFVRGSILLAMALTPTLQVAGQGPPGVSGLPGAPGTYPYAPAYYDEPFVGYQSQSALQTGSQRDAATSVLEDNIGYSLRAPFGPQLNFNGIFGDRRGIEGNDYSISGLLPWHIDPNRNVVFLNLRGTATDLGDFVGNFGLGQRMFFEDINRIFGWSAWYDLDDSHNQTYHRAGGQLEYFGRYLEIRGGADIVLDTNQQVLQSGFTSAAPFFRRNNVLFTFSSTQELAYDQGYIEAGGPMPYLGRYGVNAYGGAYYAWHEDADETLGWTVRASADITRDVQVGVRHTNDDIFGHNTSVSVSLSFPNGGLKQVIRSPRTIVRGQNPNLNQTNQVLKLRPSSVANLMSSNVVRDHRLPVNIDTEFSNIVAIDPLTGVAVCVTHVDPNAAVQGDGTYESPYRTMEAARVANDGSCRIIRVVPRSDGSGTNLAVADTFDLFTNQRLLGSSVEHEFETTRGIFTLPGFTGAGPGPLVTNAAGGDVIRMGNNTEVSGIQVVGSATGNGIVGSPTDFDINRNLIRDGLNGILLTNAVGTGRIFGNTMTGNTMDGGSVSVLAGNTLDIAVGSNTATDNGDDGMQLSATNATLVGSITDNSFNSNTMHGLRINADGSVVDFHSAALGRVISGNTVNGNMVNGVDITSTNDSTVDIRFIANSVGDPTDMSGGNGEVGFAFRADSGMSLIDIGGPLAADGNSFFNNQMHAVQYDLTGTAKATFNIQNNTVSFGGAGIGGNIFLTGHDVLFHGGQNDFDTIILDFLRSAGTASEILEADYDLAVLHSDIGNWNFTNGTQTIPTFGSVTVFDTNALIADPTLWDQVFANDGVIIVSHDTVGGGALDTPGSNAINSQAARFETAINNGFDVYANSGADLPTYYDFLPPGVLATGMPIFGSSGFTATPAGTAIGIVDPTPGVTTPTSMINGFPTHNAFLNIDPAFTVFETRGAEIVSIGVSNATITGGGFGGGAGDDAIRGTISDAAMQLPSVIRDNTIQSYAGNGVNIRSMDGGSVMDLSVDRNTITGIGMNGLRLAAANTSSIDLASMMDNTITGNGSNGTAFEATNTGLINVANVTGNDISGNDESGMFIRANGIGATVAGAIGVNGEAMNTINGNMGYGINIEASSGGRILGPGGAGNFTIVNNEIGTMGMGNMMGGINAIADSNVLPPSNSVLNLTIGGATMGDGNSIVNNMDAGISFLTRTFAKGTVLIQGNLISDTLDNAATPDPNDPMGDGIFLDRADTSLLTAMVLNNMSINNENDGLRVLSRGDDPTNVSQPMTGTANLVTFNNNTFTGNMRHGASFSVQADSVLVANGMLNEISENMGNGVDITSSGDAGFGNPAAAVRSMLDGNNISTNMGNGVGVTSTDSSRVFLSIQSSDAVGQTTIMDNILNGVAINHSSDANSDIIIQSDPAAGNTMFRTLITNNGDSTAAGGNGVLIDNSDGASTFTVQRTDITSNNIDMNGVNNGDGLSLNTTGGSPTFVIGSMVAELGNLIQSNEGDGIGIVATGGTPVYNIARNTVGARIGELGGGNLGHGTNVLLSTSATINYYDNDITRNTGRGANILTTGTVGFGVINFLNGGTGGNVISANGLEGIFYMADPQIAQDRTITLSNMDEPIAGQNDLPPSLWDERIDAMMPPNYDNDFRNLITVNDTFLTVQGNTIQNNGTRGVDSDGVGGVDGDGLYIRVGTGAYVAADVRGNDFGGNALDDFRTDSFISAANALSEDLSGANNVDTVVLKDTAQLDLRFGGAGALMNTGNQINPIASGATHTNDPLTGNVSAFLFQVDNGPGLDAGNDFVQFGTAQDIDAAFFTGGYWLRAAADPLFPNPAFPVTNPPGPFPAPFLP